MSLEPEALLEHAAFVRSVARATLRGDDLADDVVQETLITAIEDSHRRRGPLRSWLAGVARNKAHNLIRRRAASRRREEKAALSERTQGVDDVAERAEEGRRLVAAVLALEERYREPILLRYYEGLPPREIARRLEMPVETVRTRVKRGVAQLRAEVKRTHQRRPGGWQAALLPLAAAPLRGPGSTPMLVAGGALMGKKSIAWALLFLVLVGGALWLRPWEAKPDPEEAPEASLLATDADGAPAPRLDGRSPLTADALDAGPAPVDFATLDRDRDLHGTVVRTDGTPVAGASVTALHYRGKQLGVIASLEQMLESVQGPTALTARDGTFKLPLTRGDLVNLRVLAQGLAKVELPNLQAGERVRVVLAEGVRLVVRVTAPGGKPVEGVPVRLRVNEEREGYYLWALESTGADGRVVFDDLPPGLHLSLQTEPTVPGLAGPGGARIELPGEGELVHALELVPGRTLRGRVLEARTQEPIPGARVSTNFAFLPSIRTDAEGTYELVSRPDMPRARLHVTAPGYATATADVAESGETDILLGEGMTLTGRLVTEDGEAIPGARVGFQHPERNRSSHNSRGRAVTDAEGRFQVGGLAWLSHTLLVHHPGFGRLVQWVHPPTRPDEQDLGDLILRPPCEIAGRVSDAAGGPIARMPVRLTLLGDLGEGLRASERWTDDLGRFRFPDLGTDTYEVTVGPKFEPTIRKRVQVTEAQPTIDLSLTPAGVRSVAVRAVDATGAPAAGVYFQAMAKGPNDVKRDKTDARGIVTFELQHRAYVLTVTPIVGLAFARPPPIQVDAAQTRVDVVLERLVAISGRLLSPEGKPIAWGHIRIRRGEKTLQYVSAREKGVFTAYVHAGDRVSLSFEGSVQNTMQGLMKWVPYRAEVEDVAAGTEGLELRTVRLDTHRELTVRLLDPSGKPVPDMRLQIPVPPNEYRQAQTDAAGRAHWKDLPAIPLQPMFSNWRATGEQSWLSPTFERATPDGQEITARFRQGTTVEGVVLKPDGAPQQWAFVQIVEGEKPVRNALAGEDGRFVAVVDPKWTGKLTLRCEFSETAGKRRHFLASADDVQAGQRPVTLQLELVEK